MLAPGVMMEVSEVKRFLGRSPGDGKDDSTIGSIIVAAWRFAENRAGRNFGSQEYAVRLTGDDTDELFVPHRPITATSSLVLFEGNDPLVEDTDFHVDAYEGIIQLTPGLVFPSYPLKSIALTYAGGFVDEDATDEAKALYGWRNRAADLHVALMQQVGYVLARRGERSALLSQSTPDGGALSFRNDDVCPELLAALQRYSHPRIGWVG